MNKSKSIELILQTDPSKSDSQVADELLCTRSLVCMVRKKLFGPRKTASRAVRELREAEPHLSIPELVERLRLNPSTVRSAISQRRIRAAADES